MYDESADPSFPGIRRTPANKFHFNRWGPTEQFFLVIQAKEAE